MDMFDNYQNLNPDIHPDNRHKEIPCKCNHIVAGGTSTLVFELPLEYNEGLLKTSIIFNQESRLVVVKAPSDITVDETGMYVTCVLNSIESLEFGRTNLDTLVQLKLEYTDKTLFTELMKVKVIETLDDATITPDTPVVTGFGWTED